MGILLSVLFHEMLCGHTDTGYNILKQIVICIIARNNLELYNDCKFYKHYGI